MLLSFLEHIGSGYVCDGEDNDDDGDDMMM